METQKSEVNLSFPQTFEARVFKQLRHLKTLYTNVQVKQTSAVPASDKEIVTLHFKNIRRFHL